jgi:hypothetical protein
MRKNGTKKDRIRWARKGGRIGGRRRAAALTPERRREIARAGAMALWAKRRAAGEIE